MIANFFNVTLLENTRTTFNIPNSTYYIHVESREKLSNPGGGRHHPLE